MTGNRSGRDPCVNRRHVLGAVGVAGLGGVAGCTGAFDDDGDVDADDDADDDGDEAAPSFEVTAVDVVEEVPWGQAIDVDATIENVGDAEGTQDVTVTVDGDSVGSQELTIGPGETDAISLSDVDTADVGAGEHTVAVATDDDEGTATLSLVDRMGSDPRLLILSVTGGFRHDNIEEGNARIEAMSEELVADYPWETEADAVAFDVIDDPGGDASEFPDDVAELEAYDAVIWNNTTGSILDEDQQAAFREYIENGGGYAGIHSASDTHYDWEWYGELVGAYFDAHPHIQDAEIFVEDHDHPSTNHLPEIWERNDEWYDWQEIPTEDDVEILLEIDNTSYDGSIHDDVDTHPIGWYQDDDVRSWYTAGGHTHESWEEADFVEHARKGFMWAAGWYTADDLEA